MINFSCNVSFEFFRQKCSHCSGICCVLVALINFISPRQLCSSHLEASILVLLRLLIELGALRNTKELVCDCKNSRYKIVILYCRLVKRRDKWCCFHLEVQMRETRKKPALETTQAYRVRSPSHLCH